MKPEDFLCKCNLIENMIECIRGIWSSRKLWNEI